MRLKALLGLVVICLAIWCSGSMAIQYKCYSTTDTCRVCWDTTRTPWFLQEMDLGHCDTVRIGCPVCITGLAVGDSFMVPIYLYNDNPISALSLPFRHYGRSLRFGITDYGALDPTGGFMTTSQKGNLSWLTSNDLDADTVSGLLGWIDVSGTKPLSANATSVARLLGNFYLVRTAEAPAEQVVRFDTAFYPPAGEWLANNGVSIGNGAGMRPKFVICQHFTPPCDIALPVQDVNGANLPQKFELGQNMPNPFNPNTVIQFAVPRPAEVRVEVFNVLGQKVKTLANEFSKAGYKRVEWDGTDDNGSSVASGVYLYRMTSGDFSETKKMLLLK
jgi:hypothetical protein